MRFLLSHVILVFKRNCLPFFLNVWELSRKSWWQHWHLPSEQLNTPAVWFINKEFVKILSTFGGWRYTWINLMLLKPLTLFSTCAFTPDFTNWNIFRLFGMKVLVKVKLLLFSIVLGWRSSLWGVCNTFCILTSTIFSG